MEVRDCNFYGVKWDGKAIESVNIVAKALLNITELFRAQNINIEAMMRIENPSINPELKRSHHKKK